MESEHDQGRVALVPACACGVVEALHPRPDAAACCGAVAGCPAAASAGLHAPTVVRDPPLQPAFLPQAGHCTSSTHLELTAPSPHLWPIQQRHMCDRYQPHRTNGPRSAAPPLPPAGAQEEGQQRRLGSQKQALRRIEVSTVGWR